MSNEILAVPVSAVPTDTLPTISGLLLKKTSKRDYSEATPFESVSHANSVFLLK